MLERDATPETVVQRLAETVSRFQAVPQERAPEQLAVSSKPEEWSPNDLLWHLRSAADVHGEYIKRILDEEQPRWRHVSPRARMKKVPYRDLPFAESVAAFAKQRAELLGVLEALPPEAWQRVALIQNGGREQVQTLHQRAWAMAAHEMAHWAQLRGATATSSPG